MAASDPNPRSDRPPSGGSECLSAAALAERLEEEIGRAERHGTGLSCLLLSIENLDAMAREHGDALREQTIAYVAAALAGELRRFDRVGRVGRDGEGAGTAENDLLIVLPGADSPRGEIVARRALRRLRSIKVEAAGTREPLEISVGLASWQRDASAQELLARARAALRSVNGELGNGLPAAAGAPPRQPAERR